MKILEMIVHGQFKFSDGLNEKIELAIMETPPDNMPIRVVDRYKIKKSHEKYLVDYWLQWGWHLEFDNKERTEAVLHPIKTHNMYSEFSPERVRDFWLDTGSGHVQRLVEACKGKSLCDWKDPVIVHLKKIDRMDCLALAYFLRECGWQATYKGQKELVVKAPAEEVDAVFDKFSVYL